jgi:hypothetical protein
MGMGKCGGQHLAHLPCLPNRLRTLLGRSSSWLNRPLADRLLQLSLASSIEHQNQALVKLMKIFDWSWVVLWIGLMLTPTLTLIYAAHRRAYIYGSMLQPPTIFAFTPEAQSRFQHICA